MRNRRRMEWKKKKWWNLKVGGLRSGQSFASLVGACACVCSTGECPPLLGFGWDFLVNPSFPRPSPLPLELFAAELRATAGGRGTRRKRERAEWKRRGESEWLGERERSIFETPVPLGTELLSPPHAQWRSKGGGNWTTYYYSACSQDTRRTEVWDKEEERYKLAETGFGNYAILPSPLSLPIFSPLYQFSSNPRV